MATPTYRIATLVVAVAALAAVPCLTGRCAAPAVAEEGGAGAAADGPAEETGTLYYFGTSAARTSITFESDTELERILGSTTRVSGTVRFDWDKGTGSTTISVPVASMKTGLDLRDEHMRSDTWLDAANHPNITFESRALKRDEKEKRKWTYEGTLTVRGVARAVKGEATVLQFTAEQAERLGPGEWARVRTSFEVNLDDHGIKIPNPTVAAKVNKVWSVSVDLFATTEKPKEK